MWTIEEQRKNLKILTDEFDSEGINYMELNDGKRLFIYVLEGEYARTEENYKNGGFVPDFRISTRYWDSIGTYYVKDCGVIKYMSKDIIIKKFKN